MKSKHIGSTLDVLFEELGELEEVEAMATKKILALQAERRMKELGLATTTLAARMGTSGNQVHRLLDEGDAGITLKVLFRMFKALQMPLRVAFVRRGTRRAAGGAATGQDEGTRPACLQGQTGY